MFVFLTSSLITSIAKDHSVQKFRFLRLFSNLMVTYRVIFSVENLTLEFFELSFLILYP